MLLYNPQHHLWIGERYGAGSWQFPQGGVGSKQTPRQAVIRELCEELGLEPHHLGLIEKLKATHRYDFERTPPHWEGRYRGQSQTFWAVEFRGKDGDIDVSRQSPPEFSGWEWCPVEEVLHRVEPIRRPGYRQPLTEFINSISKL